MSYGESSKSATPSANNDTPHSTRSERSNIRVLHPGETIEPVPSEQAPPKLKLKLRNLAPKVAHTPPPNETSRASATPSLSISKKKSFVRPKKSLPQTQTAGKVVKLGSASNPIDIDSIKTPSPHQFLNRPSTYRVLNSKQYRPFRPKHAPKLYTPNGVVIDARTVNSRQNHGIYRTSTFQANVTAPSSFPPANVHEENKPGRNAAGMQNHHRTNGHVHPVHVESTYRLDPAAIPSRPSYPQYTPPKPYQPPPNVNPVSPNQDEDLLRKRAVQYVLEHGRPRLRKRRFSDDPDATSGPEHSGASMRIKRGQRDTQLLETPPDISAASTPSTGASEEEMFDRNSRLTEMVEHTQLIASLFMAYPYSTDRKGLREDIAVLATVTEKQLQAWLSAEDRFDLDTMERKTFSATTPTPSPRNPNATKSSQSNRTKSRNESVVLNKKMTTEETRAAKRMKDDELKQYLSTESDFWEALAEKGTGETSKMLPAYSGAACTLTEELRRKHTHPAPRTMKVPSAGGRTLALEKKRFSQPISSLQPQTSGKRSSPHRPEERRPTEAPSPWRVHPRIIKSPDGELLLRPPTS